MNECEKLLVYVFKKHDEILVQCLKECPWLVPQLRTEIIEYFRLKINYEFEVIKKTLEIG